MVLAAAVAGPEIRVPQERRRAVRQAMALIRQGDREAAQESLIESVHRQARWSAGLEQHK